MIRWFVLKIVDRVRKRAPHQKVVRLCNRYLRWADRYGRLRADLLWRRGFAYYRIGGAEHVTRFLADVEEAQQLCTRYGYWGNTYGHVLGVKAIFQQQTAKNLAEARRLYEHALNYLTGRSRIATLIPYGSLLKELGEYDAAYRVLTEAASKARDMRHHCCALLELGRLCVARGDEPRAQMYLRSAQAVAEQHKFWDELGDVYRELGRIEVRRCDRDRAARCFELAAGCYERSGALAKRSKVRTEASAL